MNACHIVLTLPSKAATIRNSPWAKTLRFSSVMGLPFLPFTSRIVMVTISAISVKQQTEKSRRDATSALSFLNSKLSYSKLQNCSRPYCRQLVRYRVVEYGLLVTRLEPGLWTRKSVSALAICTK
jgi:hypothetical protein